MSKTIKLCKVYLFSTSTNLNQHTTSHKYEGRSTNKLQNSIILLVYQILKIRFVGNSIQSSSCEFYCDDVL